MFYFWHQDIHPRYKVVEQYDFPVTKTVAEGNFLKMIIGLKPNQRIQKITHRRSQSLN
jgi:hypothetical protein